MTGIGLVALTQAIQLRAVDEYDHEEQAKTDGANKHGQEGEDFVSHGIYFNRTTWI
jgi:hypothetical protein